MSEIKETLLERQFIDSAVELAKIQMNESLKPKEKEMRMNMVWRGFRRFIYENFEEK